MDIELLEIRDHLGRFAPFDHLSDVLLDAVVSQIEVSYFKAGSEILARDQETHELCYIRSGAVEMFRRSGSLYNRLSEGDIFGYSDLLRNKHVRFPVRAIEDTLIYFIPERIFERLCEEDDAFADFVEAGGSRLKMTVEQQRRESDMMMTRVRKLINRRPATIEAGASLQHAAQRMTDQGTTSVLVLSEPGEDWLRNFTDAQGHEWRLAGILTDRDFCTRVLAAGITPDTPVSEVMTEELLTVQSDESVYEAMLCMLRSNVHHLPVLHRRRPIGLLHLSDIVRYETHSSLYLVSNIFNQSSDKGLARLSADVRAAFVQLVAEGATSQMIGRALSTIGRSFTRRLLELGEARLGPPPVPYSFMALGSMARDEQTIITDQDNALVLDDRFEPGQHDDYFAALAKFVSDGLDACGYSYCKGDIMATNPRWRQPLRVWKEYFSTWIEEPNPKRLLDSSIFFDLDSVHGEEAFVEQLQDLVAEKASRSPLFLAAMARNARNRTPPLGFFRTFVMENDGKHNNSINLKRRGTAPLVDLIRVHAMACGSRSQNTFNRLDDIAAAKLLPEGVSDRLRYAFEFISMVRIRHQVLDIEAEREPDNNIEPENVSSSDRHHLKDAFEALSHAQKFLKFRYSTSSKSSLS
ncbi:CBS domain-containing protein [Modicisalibacter ilicicola DSM 19980]|uniref:CBS domain-containing protein n=1 Tax=Modicisalibacter ilicicola DSM 19980 TaxID=1121942 RepID=A0A1M4YIH9_9GAMM|nr:DUF294 nucleotidyltransferase-like domain-containing protein [Halomonas ilicicola]SHF05615.1 CBS domain-containing protein [Halomonas ilicicola DSM 19980]